MWILIYVLAFIAAFGASVALKLLYDPYKGEFKADWSDSVGKVYRDFSYGDGAANKFDLYVPADNSRRAYGLVVYLHAGGFTSGDKSDDAEVLKWLCSKGYVAAGVNYTLFGEEHPEASVYSQSTEIRESIPHVIAQARQLGYPINEMAISGGSAGGCLALLYAYRDGKDAPVPVKMVFEAVGPSCFYPGDWTSYGLSAGGAESEAAARALFGAMAGREIQAAFGTPEYDEEVRQISPLLWVDEHSAPTLMAYGKYDKIQPCAASQRLLKALEANGVPHDYYLCAHSGHGLQNDNATYAQYLRKIPEYLATYMPLK